MSFYLLPQIHNTISCKHVTILINNDDDDKCPDDNNCNSGISKSLHNYLNNIKKEIDLYSNEWDVFKKYTNPYEYIHTTIPYYKQSVCKLKPLSRSFFKLIEIVNLLSLYDVSDESNASSDKINTFHLAEGPGGFIEAIEWFRNNPNDKYYGMTLISNDNNVPGWKKSSHFLSKHKNVIIETGISKNGDLSDKKNLLYCLDKYRNTMDFVTGDGGFDFSIDFNKQESMCIKLLYYQISFALAIQKKGGNFILKVFDIFTEASVDLLYILSLCYEKIYIVKPYSSRYANSEKYIVCKNFKLEDSREIVNHLSENYELINNAKKISRFLNIDIPYLFLNKLEEYNAIIGQQQIENIVSTLYLINNNNKPEKLDSMKNINIQKCLQWCIKYNLPYVKNITENNIFVPLPE